jgi:glutamate N-acetyltransferase/amino-acid N-acetyltransferase
MSDTQGGLFAVPGLRGAACATGVKASGELDLALIAADETMSAAGVFTTNATAAAPVWLCRGSLAEDASARAIVINSGNANALTGPDGVTHARAMAARAVAHCGGPALVLSTGVIGVPLPIERVLDGIDRAAPALAPDCGDVVDRAILTTDSRTKTCALGADGYVVGGVAKGSGMIHPNMATMLAIIATDAPIDAPRLRQLLAAAVDRSFHEISVDGDTSTNDAVLLLARKPAADRPALPSVERAIVAVAQSLARQIIQDGEGATRTMEIDVARARSEDDARRIASAIARSSLVKTALAGGDPNWGRILSAAGTAGVDLDVDDITLRLGGVVVFERGRPLTFDAHHLGELFAAAHVHVELDLGRGDHRGRMLTTDLSRRYVEINSEYTT